MIFFCYVCPPAACIFMGRPFSAILACVLCLFFWLPGIAYALTVYVDYKANKHMGTLTGAIRGGKGGGGKQVKVPKMIDHPRIGANGHRFKRKKRK